MIDFFPQNVFNAKVFQDIEHRGIDRYSLRSPIASASGLKHVQLLIQLLLYLLQLSEKETLLFASFRLLTKIGHLQAVGVSVEVSCSCLTSRELFLHLLQVIGQGSVIGGKLLIGDLKRVDLLLEGDKALALCLGLPLPLFVLALAFHQLSVTGL